MQAVISTRTHYRREDEGEDGAPVAHHPGGRMWAGIALARIHGSVPIYRTAPAVISGPRRDQKLHLAEMLWSTSPRCYGPPRRGAMVHLAEVLWSTSPRCYGPPRRDAMVHHRDLGVRRGLV